MGLWPLILGTSDWRREDLVSSWVTGWHTLNETASGTNTGRRGAASSVGTTLDNLLTKDIDKRQFTEFKVSWVYVVRFVVLRTFVLQLWFLWKHGSCFYLLHRSSYSSCWVAELESRGTSLKTGVSALSLKCSHPWKIMANAKWVSDKREVYQEFKQAPDGCWDESSRSLSDGWIEDGRAEFRFCLSRFSFFVFAHLCYIASIAQDLLHCTFTPCCYYTAICPELSFLTGKRIQFSSLWQCLANMCVFWHMY